MSSEWKVWSVDLYAVWCSVSGSKKEDLTPPRMEVIEKDGAPFVAAGGDMMDGVGKVEAKLSCHSPPRFPRDERIPEESPWGRKNAPRIGRCDGNLYDRWAGEWDAKNEGVTPRAPKSSRSFTRERRCDPKSFRDRSDGQ